MQAPEPAFVLLLAISCKALTGKEALHLLY
jgi:hypothetical protein